MFKVLLMLTIIVSLFGNQDRFSEGVKEYENQNYKKGIEIFHSLIEEGYESGELFYNLGNSYFREGRFDLAIYYYEIARNYIYNDEDLNTNLSIARLQLVDKPEERVELFLVTYIKNMIHSFNLSCRSNLLTLSALIFGITLSIYFFMKRSKLKSFIYIVSLLGLILFIYQGIALYLHYQFCNRDQGVVIDDYVSAYSSPDIGSNSTQLFNLHRGTLVELSRRTSDWFEVKISDQKVGWIKAEKIKPFIQK